MPGWAGLCHLLVLMKLTWVHTPTHPFLLAYHYDGLPHQQTTGMVGGRQALSLPRIRYTQSALACVLGDRRTFTYLFNKAKALGATICQTGRQLCSNSKPETSVIVPTVAEGMKRSIHGF